VPLLTWSDPLPHRPMRVLVAGPSGSGKTTMCALLARSWGLLQVELDALHHGPNWVPRPEFEADVHAFVARPRWVTEWQYTSKLGSLLADHADLVVWLDHPRRTVMRQVVVRTVVRRLRDEELWNGNREGPLRALFTDPDHIIRWAWRTHGRPGEKVRDLLAEHDTTIVRLRGVRQRKAWTRLNLSGD
jgi:adenylate kinase family enzyme